MKNSIRQTIDNCKVCREDRPAQARPTVHIMQPSSALYPMNEVGTDLFDAIGKKWIVLVDRYSGYAWTQELRRTDTSTVIGQLSDWFTEVGWPMTIRTDGGPQFRTEFSLFCDKNSIKHELSSPYNPEYNGLAEAAVKNIKSIITRCNKEGENLKLAIAAWRNMARTDGVSPSQLFYGRRQRQLLPLTGEQAKSQASSTAGRDKTAGDSERIRGLRGAR